MVEKYCLVWGLNRGLASSGSNNRWRGRLPLHHPATCLLATHLSGLMDIISFTQVSDTAAWSIFGDAINTEAISHPLQHVIDEKTGMILPADRSRIKTPLITKHFRHYRYTLKSMDNVLPKLIGVVAVQRTQIVEKMGVYFAFETGPIC